MSDKDKVNTGDKPEIEVIENADGTVTVGNLDFTPDEDPDTAGGASDVAGGNAEDDAEGDGSETDTAPVAHADDEDHDGPSEAEELASARNDKERAEIRKRRSEERRERRAERRNRERAAQAELASLRNQVQQLNSRLGSVDNKLVGTELAQIDEAIARSGHAAEAYKAQYAQLAGANDHANAAEAMRQMVRAEEHANNLKRVRQNYVSQSQTRQSPGAVAGPDPEMVRQVQTWSSRNDWYNPNPTGVTQADNDSRVVRALDDAVMAEGFNPTTKAYWDELDRRIAKVLPHRAARGAGRNGRSIPSGKQAQRSTVAGVSRDSTGASNGAAGAGGFTLSRERVQAMKDAGFWNDPKERADQIRRYRESDAQAARTQRRN